MQGRTREFILMAAVSGILVLLALAYFVNIEPGLKEAETGYSSGTIINLDGNFKPDKLKELLSKGDYFADTQYENFVAWQLKDKVNTANGSVSNLGELNKSAFQVNAVKMDESGGELGKSRYLFSATELGYDELPPAEAIKNLTSNKQVSEQRSRIKIYGKVKTVDKKPVSGVVVKLTEELPQTVKDSILDSFIKNARIDQLIDVDLDKVVKLKNYYTKTDAKGKFSFTNIVRGKNYSVIPVQKGKEYGILPGQAQIRKSSKFNFTEKEHKLTLFDPGAYSRIKKDKIFTVRTPEVFRGNYLKSILFFMLGFWLFFLSLIFNDKKTDPFILPLLMLLSGIGMIVLFAVQDPLRDLDYGSSIGSAVLATMAAFAVINLFVREKWILQVSRISLLKQLNTKNLLPKYVSGRINPNKQSRGYFWLILSTALIIMLWIFGTGPEGSGVKVNLFGFQISELSKFLMIVFFAKYFTANHDYFREIPNNIYLFKNYFRQMLIMFLLLIGLYLVGVGDQGPAIVLCITFLIFYSFAKNEFFRMVLTALIYAVTLFALSKLTQHNLWIVTVYAFAVLIGVCIYVYRAKKNESMAFVVLLISSFIILSLFPFDFSQRLADRNSMFANIWDNHLHGGDQVAQGVWALSSGGWFGQGPGNGFSNVMPAYHTDMIFESIGEGLGIIVLTGILILYGLLFYRSMLVARRTGKLFFFYLINGFALATLVQLAIIVAGSLGLMPLTGISVPFLSKGNVGLIINLSVFLSIIILSQIKGEKHETKFIRENFDNVNAYTLITFLGIIVLFAGTLVFYNIQSDKNIVKPVKTLSRQNEWIYSYNPRISIFADKLKSGNIYDRNGLLLATDSRDEFIRSKAASEQAFANMNLFNNQKNKNYKRYYPFSEDLVYWLGNRNNNMVSNENTGFVAEFRLLSRLRGFNTKPSNTIKATSDSYRESSYLPEETKETNLVRYDYSYFVPFIKAGKDSKLIKKHNERNDLDVRLTVDAKLNQTINSVIRAEEYSNYKVSVVAVKTSTGDVLASAQNPAPKMSEIRKISRINPKYFQKLFSASFGYNAFVADRDYGMYFRSVPGSSVKFIDALAYLRRTGAEGARKTYYISETERIRQTGYESDPSGKVDMHTAIVHSSNNYFIWLMNDQTLHPELFHLYNTVGINIANIGGFYTQKPDNYNNIYFEELWYKRIAPGKELFNNPKHKGTRDRFMKSDYSWIAWGQGPVEATPLQMARLMGAVANKGKLYENNFVMKAPNDTTPYPMVEDLENKQGITELLGSFLKEQAASFSAQTGLTVYGKTGSPERIERYYDKKTGKTRVRKVTDGWYVFYIENSKYDGSPIAFAVRIQSKGGSSNAKEIAGKILAKIKQEYFKQADALSFVKRHN
ncbi:MAG: FtsW/RodA/SpoVE family cell cycle protein [Paludibacteraceae bacterium]